MFRKYRKYFNKKKLSKGEKSVGKTGKIVQQIDHGTENESSGRSEQFNKHKSKDKINKMSRKQLFTDILKSYQIDQKKKLRKKKKKRIKRRMMRKTKGMLMSKSAKYHLLTTKRANSITSSKICFQ